MKKNKRIKKIKEKIRQLYRTHRLKSLITINTKVLKDNCVLSIICNESRFTSKLSNCPNEAEGENLFQSLANLEGKLGYDVATLLTAIRPRNPHTFIEDMLLKNSASIFVSKIDLKIWLWKKPIFICEVKIGTDTYRCTSKHLYSSIVGATGNI